MLVIHLLSDCDIVTVNCDNVLVRVELLESAINFRSLENFALKVGDSGIFRNVGVTQNTEGGGVVFEMGGFNNPSMNYGSYHYA